MECYGDNSGYIGVVLQHEVSIGNITGNVTLTAVDRIISSFECEVSSASWFFEFSRLCRALHRVSLDWLIRYDR